MSTVKEWLDQEDKIEEMLKREVQCAKGVSQDQRERWVLIRRQFKISKQLNRIEEMLEKLNEDDGRGM